MNKGNLREIGVWILNDLSYWIVGTASSPFAVLAAASARMLRRRSSIRQTQERRTWRPRRPRFQRRSVTIPRQIAVEFSTQNMNSSPDSFGIFEGTLWGILPYGILSCITSTLPPSESTPLLVLESPPPVVSKSSFPPPLPPSPTPSVQTTAIPGSVSPSAASSSCSTGKINSLAQKGHTKYSSNWPAISITRY